MLIGEDENGYTVAFEARSIDDVLALDDGRDEELEFAAVAGLSEWATKTYELTWQPALRALVTPAAAEIRKRSHPLRLQHYFFSYRNPLFSNIGTLAEATHKHRAAADKNNPYLAFEQLCADVVEQGFAFFRDTRDAAIELMFHSLYGTPWMKRIGAAEQTLPACARRPRLPAGAGRHQASQNGRLCRRHCPHARAAGARPRRGAA